MRTLIALITVAFLAAGCGSSDTSTPSPKAVTSSFNAAHGIVTAPSSGMKDHRNAGGQEESTRHSWYVTAAKFGKAWPLTVDRGIVNCLGTGGPATIEVFDAPDGTRYALNGTALDAHMGFKRINPIWADDPDVPGLKKNIGPLTDMCDRLLN